MKHRPYYKLVEDMLARGIAGARLPADAADCKPAGRAASGQPPAAARVPKALAAPSREPRLQEVETDIVHCIPYLMPEADAMFRAMPSRKVTGKLLLEIDGGL